MRRYKFILRIIYLTLVGMFIFLSSSAYADPLDVWTSRTSNTVNQLRECTLGNNMFICVGLNGTIVTSPDGVTPWTVRRTGTENLGGVAYGNGKFVAVGYGPTILTSEDGVTWTKRTSANSKDLERVAFGNNLFVAVGDGRTIQTSPNGVNWTLRESGGANPEYGIAYGNGVWIAVGANSRIWRSNDSSGETWTRISPPAIPGVPGTTEFRRVAFGNNMFVAVGDTKAGGTTHGIIVTSPDGLNWTARTVPEGTVFLRGTRYGVGSFVVTGYSGTILTSTDGVNWVRRTSGVSTDLRGVGFGISSGNGTFVTGGDGGLILQSDPYTAPGAPTEVTAVAGNAEATVSFTAPASNGGSPIISYTVTSSLGNIATGASSPITVTGLTNGTAYTFTVTATNAIGTGPASAQSNSVTPSAVPGIEIPNQTLTDYVINFADGVTVKFSQITGPCTISKTVSETPPGPTPSGYRFIGTFYDITKSDCSTSGPIYVTIPYNESLVPVAETSLRLFHWEGGFWTDVTVSVNTASNTITGQVSFLSPFGAGYPYGGLVTGANKYMIAFLAFIAISTGVFLIKKHRLMKTGSF